MFNDKKLDFVKWHVVKIKLLHHIKLYCRPHQNAKVYYILIETMQLFRKPFISDLNACMKQQNKFDEIITKLGKNIWIHY